MRLIGFDPGLQTTGWGVIDIDGNRLSYVADGLVQTSAKASLSERLVELHAGLKDVIDEFSPDEAAVEETFVNKNAVSTLKLGQARGIVLVVPALAGLAVAEYLPNLVKKTVVGTGHAQKQQVEAMVKMLLPGAMVAGADAADALAVAICHAHHRGTADKVRKLARAAG